MAARNWTIEQRAKQAAAIHAWQPWKHSTGARTIEGKVKVSRNAFRPTQRKNLVFVNWLLAQLNKTIARKAHASREEIERRAAHCLAK